MSTTIQQRKTEMLEDLASPTPETTELVKENLQHVRKHGDATSLMVGSVLGAGLLFLGILVGREEL